MCVELVGTMSEVPSVVSWRESLPRDALVEVYAWLEKGDPDAGVKAVAVRHMIAAFIDRYETAWEKTGRVLDDIPDPKPHTAWGDPPEWWFVTTRVLSPFAETPPAVWSAKYRPSWLSINQDVNICAHIPLHSNLGPFPLCHCTICYPVELVAQHGTDGAALVRMAMVNACDVHMHERCEMHLTNVSASAGTGAASSVVPGVHSPDILGKIVALEERVATLEAACDKATHQLGAAATAYKDVLPIFVSMFQQGAGALLLQQMAFNYQQQQNAMVNYTADAAGPAESAESRLMKEIMDRVIQHYPGLDVAGGSQPPHKVAKLN